ncbi:MAG: discoidin domain-containing protein [bacterium]|nr:discoidin domain-containing protein [bacterium]
MKRKIFYKSLLLAMCYLAILCAQSTTLDDFEPVVGWNDFKADAVNINISQDDGLYGKCIRFSYDFTKGTGYGGIQKLFALDLPDNFEFTFYLKAESPSNNFEIKFLDSTGQNVWWVNNRNYDFPKDWKKIKIKKRHIQFAWGPTNDQSLKRIDRIEFTIASVVGGKGTIWIDELKFEPRPLETESYPKPIVFSTSSTIQNPISNCFDNNPETFWQSLPEKVQHVKIDFQNVREFGGLYIQWHHKVWATSFEILISENNSDWEKVYSVSNNESEKSFIRLPDSETRYIKINLIKRNEAQYGINEIKILSVNKTKSLNDFIVYASKNSLIGDFPRYFSEQASYWTVVGLNSDVKEALINEDGMVEIERGGFSIEPMLYNGIQLLNWSNTLKSQSLENNYLPIPNVKWESVGNVSLDVRAFANGQANEGSVLYLKYSINNMSEKKIKSNKLYLLVRPFQVNPYYQFLNLEGGVGRINSIKEQDGKIYVNHDKVIFPVTKYNSFGASAFDEYNIVSSLWEGKIPTNISVVDPTHLPTGQTGLASGILKYDFNLEPGEEKVVYLAVPFYGEETLPQNLNGSLIEQNLVETKDFWEEKLNHIKFNLPESADKIIHAWKSNIAYILINRDKAGIQPGSRSYERSWIRDGSLTSSALLKSGIVEEVKEFIDWYAAHQYENGKVPCVVDSRGPDPVPEHDSHGQMIYLIKEYFNFTKDTTFLRSKNENVLKAVEYIESLIAERSTDHFKNGNDSVRAYYGLVTESISHEGYSAKPMHSYWDNFFTMKGLKDAAQIQLILGEKEYYERIKKVRILFGIIYTTH